MSLSFHDRSKNSFFGPYRRKRVNQPLPGTAIDDSKTAKQPATYKSYDEMTLGERDIRKEVDRNLQFANEGR
jgi:hypothetical protein